MFDRWKNWLHSSAHKKNLDTPPHRIRLLQKHLKLEIPPEHYHLFYKALRHRSIISSDKYKPEETYERLEFLGDAVLDLIVSEILYSSYPEKNEGYLTKLRSKIVKGETLAILAKELRLNDVMEIGDRASGQGIELSKSILADVYEAIVAALYLSMGYKTTFEFVQANLRQFLNLEKIEKKVDNFKSMLMEHAQSEKMNLPEYRVLSEEGPGHNKTFKVSVLLNHKTIGTGIGKSKKQAEQDAAKKALGSLGLLN